MIVFGALFVAAVLAITIHRRIEVLLAPVLITFTLIVYAFAVFQMPNLGITVNIVVSLFSMFVLCLCLRSQEKRVLFREYVMTTGILVYLVFLAFFLLWGTGRRAMATPDPNYWIVPIKKFYYSGSLLDSYVDDPIHPFFSLVYGYLVEKTWYKWAEGMLVYGGNMLIISMLLPLMSFCDSKSDKTEARGIFLGASFFLIPFLARNNTLDRYDIDVMMTVAICMGVVLAIEYAMGDDLFYLLASNSYFVTGILLKRIGISVAFLLMFFITCVLLSKKRFLQAGLYNFVTYIAYIFLWKIDKYSFAMLALAFLPIIGWLIDKWGRNFKLAPKAVSSFGLGLIVMAIYGVRTYWIADDNFKREVLRVYWNSFWNTEKYSVANMGVGYFFLISCLVFLLMCTAEVGIRKYLYYFLGIVLCNIGYTVILAYLYCVAVAPHTIGKYGRYIDSFDRYILLIPFSIILFYLYVVVKEYKNLLGSIVLLLVIFFSINKSNVLNYLLVIPERTEFYGFSQAGITIDDTDVIGYIDMNENSDYWDFLLFCTPATVSYVEDLSYYSMNTNGTSMTENELRTQLSACDYVYIQSINDTFSTIYNDLFEGDVKAGGTIYRFDENTGKLCEYSK